MEGKWQRRGKVRVKSEDSWTPGLATRRREPIKKKEERESERGVIMELCVCVEKRKQSK